MPKQVLSRDEIEAYRRDGYVVPQFRFSGEKLARLQQLADELIDANKEFGDTPMVCPHVPGGGAQGLHGNRAWLDYSADSDVLDMVEQIIGRDIILWGTNLFHKPSGTGRRIPYHRDGRYWPIDPLATMTVWIAIEPTTRANGCLEIVPGSHHAGKVGDHFTSTDPSDAIPETIAPDEFDPAAAVSIELEVGQMALFDVFTIHGSDANRSDTRRLGYAMRYMPSTSLYNHDGAERTEQVSAAHNTRPLFLMRGIDRTGKNDFKRGHPEIEAV